MAVHVLDAAYTADGLLALTPDGVLCRGPAGSWIKAASLPPATPVRLVAKDFDTFSIIDNAGYLWERTEYPHTWRRVIDVPEAQP